MLQKYPLKRTSFLQMGPFSFGNYQNMPTTVPSMDGTHRAPLPHPPVMPTTIENEPSFLPGAHPLSQK